MLDRAVFAPYRVFTNLAGIAARKAERTDSGVSGQYRAFHRFEETDGASDAVASMPFPAPAGAGADVEIFKYDRVTKLQHLRIGEAGVRHMRVNRIGAVEAGARGRA